jgi:DNA-binding MarR family transcriptional regulator
MHSANVVVAWTNAVQDRMQAEARSIGLESRELAALTLVATHDGCSLDWLRRRIELTQSGTVRLVDRLADRDLLTRGASTGRGVPLHVTVAGSARLDRWAQRRDRIVEDLLARLPGERDALVAAMAATLEAERRQRDQADAACRTCTWPACGSDCPVDRSVPSGRS